MSIPELNLDLTSTPKLTPMMEQYRSIKKTLPSATILFFRLGDFYEMFFDDAVQGAEILNITLTGREAGAAGRIPMCGFPYHAFSGYVRLLLDKNLKVAVCEQVGEPSKTKGLMERKVTRLITPATYLDDENASRTSEYLAAVIRKSGEAAIAYLELGTGDFWVRRVSEDRLLDELALIHPREVILPKSLAEGAVNDFAKEWLHAAVSVYEDWIFETSESADRLKQVFHLSGAQSLSFHDDALAVGACGAVLYYLHDHFHHALGHVRIPKIIQAHACMILDRQAQKSLELVANEQGRKGLGTLFRVLDETLTSMGTRQLEEWILRPLVQVKDIHARQESIKELVQNRMSSETLMTLLSGIRDMERTLSRLNSGVANARDLVNLKNFLNRIPDLRTELSRLASDLLLDFSKKIQPFPALCQMIDSAIVSEPPLTVREGSMIREKYSAELDEYRHLSQNGKQWILDFQQREIERTGIKSLKVKYSQVFGYGIEISKNNLNAVPDNYIRRQTLANAERFVLPELTEWDQKISGAQDKMKVMEYEIFNQIRGRVLEQLTPLQEMARAVGSLDALLALARVANQKQWVCPEVTEGDVIHIEAGRHPVVENMLPLGKFVENDLLLNQKDHQLIILTGPNMAGKSTYIRQTALIVLLAQIGSFVPAKACRVGVVDRIFTRIGASDDLARGESTFMVEMLETSRILNEATSRSLLILDEVGRGTSTFDGLSIAWAICERLASGVSNFSSAPKAQPGVKPRTLFATHYHELTQLEGHFPSICNYTMKVKETSDEVLFLRKVIRGASDRSYGIHVAQLAGLPAAVTTRAKEILKVLETENKEATQILEGGRPAINSSSVPSAQPVEHPLVGELKELDINSMTPIQALQKLEEFKSRASVLRSRD